MAIAIDMLNQYGVDSVLRSDYFNYYGFNRNNFLYNCNLYSCSENKEDSICFSCCFVWRFSWNDYCKYCVSNNVMLHLGHLKLVHFCTNFKCPHWYLWSPTPHHPTSTQTRTPLEEPQRYQ